jgi:hypothetical protein
MTNQFNPVVVPFDAKSDWTDPDMSVISPERPPAPEMDDAQFAMVFGP